jgi:hypothetical protein
MGPSSLHDRPDQRFGEVRGRTYSIVGVNGSGLFDPAALGLNAVRHLANAIDQSAVMEKVRESLRGRPLQPGRNSSEDEIEKWIEGTFSLKYW